MGKIRSFLDFVYTDVDGNVVKNGAFVSRWFDGVNLFIDDKYISARKFNRRICKCGNVDDLAPDQPCESCGNTDFKNINLSSGRWYRSREQRVYEQKTHLTDDGVVGYYIDIQWDSTKNCFVLVEHKYDVLKYDNGFYTPVVSNVDLQDATSNFMKYVKSRPEWSQALDMLATYPVECIQNLNKRGYHDDVMSVCINYYNMYYAIPNIQSVSPDLFIAIYEKFISIVNRKYESLQDFYKESKCPLSLSDVYGIAGLPNCDLLAIDDLDETIIRAISYALIHKHVQYHELDGIFHKQDIPLINSYGVEFAEFFRKNIVKYSSRTWAAFLYIDSEYNATGIKDANIKKFARYAEKKGVKRDKIVKFADLMYEGNAIEALQSLL